MGPRKIGQLYPRYDLFVVESGSSRGRRDVCAFARRACPCDEAVTTTEPTNMRIDGTVMDVEKMSTDVGAWFSKSERLKHTHVVMRDCHAMPPSAPSRGNNLERRVQQQHQQQQPINAILDRKEKERKGQKRGSGKNAVLKSSIQTSAASLPRLRLETRESERGKSRSRKAQLVKQSSAQNFMKSDGLPNSMLFIRSSA